MKADSIDTRLAKILLIEYAADKIKQIEDKVLLKGKVMRDFQRLTEIALIVLIYLVVIYAIGCQTVKGLAQDGSDFCNYVERSIAE